MYQVWKGRMRELTRLEQVIYVWLNEKAAKRSFMSWYDGPFVSHPALEAEARELADKIRLHMEVDEKKEEER